MKQYNETMKKANGEEDEDNYWKVVKTEKNIIMDEEKWLIIVMDNEWKWIWKWRKRRKYG